MLYVQDLENHGQPVIGTFEGLGEGYVVYRAWTQELKTAPEDCVAIINKEEYSRLPIQPHETRAEYVQRRRYAAERLTSAEEYLE